MKQILQNMATIELLRYCRINKIDCSDTYTYKYPRRFTYALIKNGRGKAIVTMTLFKNQTPGFITHN